jgi:signal transduction histidine kinase
VQRVFDPFVTTRMGRGGTGLGLHIAHNAATQILGGTLEVDSTPGQGTRFTLRLPRQAPRRTATARDGAAPGG